MKIENGKRVLEREKKQQPTNTSKSREYGRGKQCSALPVHKSLCASLLICARFVILLQFYISIIFVLFGRLTFVVFYISGQRVQCSGTSTHTQTHTHSPHIYRVKCARKCAACL